MPLIRVDAFEGRRDVDTADSYTTTPSSYRKIYSKKSTYIARC